MCPSDLMTIVEIDTHKDPSLRRVTTILSTDKTLELSLDLGKAAGSYYNLLLVVSGQ